MANGAVTIFNPINKYLKNVNKYYNKYNLCEQDRKKISSMLSTGVFCAAYFYRTSLEFPPDRYSQLYPVEYFSRQERFENKV